MAAPQNVSDSVKNCCCSCIFGAENTKISNISREIELRIRRDRREAKKQVKLLLLGIGEAGKSTVIKQMQIIHGNGFQDEQRHKFVQSIYDSVVESIQLLLSAMKAFHIPFRNTAAEENAGYFSQQVGLSYNADNIPAMFESAKIIWADDGVQECYERRHDFCYVYLSDSAKHFLDKMDELASPNYLPNDEDILLVRKSTTGVQEYSFKIAKVIFRMVDVGGQRTERRKWIHCFENVKSIIFVTSLADYDQFLLTEDPVTGEEKVVNRLEESIALFTVVTQEPFLGSASIILFLNKTDVFEDKIKDRHLENFFPEFRDFIVPPPRASRQNTESKSPDPRLRAGQEFVLKKYVDFVQSHSRSGRGSSSRAEQLLYHHFTCATDTNAMRAVTRAVEDYIIRTSLIDFHLTF